MDVLRRYFVGNPCPIISVRLTPFSARYIPANGGNFGGFYWLWFKVTWRRPFANCWSWNEQRRRWEISPTPEASS